MWKKIKKNFKEKNPEFWYGRGKILVKRIDQLSRQIFRKSNFPLGEVTKAKYSLVHTFFYFKIHIMTKV